MNQRRRRSSRVAPEPAQRTVDYRQLRNPFPTMNLLTDDAASALHLRALDVLSDLGVKVLLPEARRIFAHGGALVDEATEMVRIGPDMIDAALASAPRSIACRAGTRARDIVLEPGALVFQPGAGAPHATDLDRGRRPGSDRDFRELVQLTQHFDALHMVPPLVEPQDITLPLRHYAMTQAQLSLSDKLPFVFSRGTGQVQECFEMIAGGRGLSDDAFAAASHCYTIINTNSPRQIDRPMAQGIIDFARAGQVSIITPFTLMGAMAPITAEAAVMLSHAEALAAIVLAQLARSGAPVLYGTFTSNVDMKSGAPAFGTPEHFRASLIAGQMARHIDLPWRCASGSAANMADAQAAHETQFALWGCLMAGATVVIHAAGWLEGGLTVSYEKLITDMEAVQMVADLCVADAPGSMDAAFEAIAEAEPGGHFFGTPATMARYRDAFYEPLVADWSNYGTWSEAGARDATQRAKDKWQDILAKSTATYLSPDRQDWLDDYVQRAKERGGVPPMD